MTCWPTSAWTPRASSRRCDDARRDVRGFDARNVFNSVATVTALAVRFWSQRRASFAGRPRAALPNELLVLPIAHAWAAPPHSQEPPCRDSATFRGGGSPPEDAGPVSWT